MQLQAKAGDNQALSEQAPQQGEDSKGLSVLVVDDDEINRAVLKAMLQKDGHTVHIAANGAEAVAHYEAEQPDMVLMDIMMPVMDGYEAAQSIKASAGFRFVPIIFVTAIIDDQALAKCLAVGGDDFITKPISLVILRAKLAAADRIRRLYGALALQQSGLSAHHERLRYEHELAEQVFAKIVGNSSANAANIRAKLAPLAITNGDLILVGRTPHGRQNILMGDCMGHGLSAAIGAIPVTDIFNAMSRKGLVVGDMVKEMNRKLRATLPAGHFFAACLMEWDPRGGVVHIWNGGVPDVLLVAEGGRAVTRIASRNLALGVVDNEEMDIHVETCRVQRGDRLYLYSDGLVDVRDGAGLMFGQERLEKVVRDNRDRRRLFEEINEAVESFRGDRAQEDDITLVEVLCDESLLDGAEAHGEKPRRQPSCGMSIKLGPGGLGHFDPLNLVDSLVGGIAALENHRTPLYTVIAELYANALEHGVLKLDCALKKAPEGFAHYYDERERRLSELTEGWVNIDIEIFSNDAGGELILQIEDSGQGFAAVAASDTVQADSGVAASGRGISLARSLCKSLAHDARGNRARAVYAW